MLHQDEGDTSDGGRYRALHAQLVGEHESHSLVLHADAWKAAVRHLSTQMWSTAEGNEQSVFAGYGTKLQKFLHPVLLSPHRSVPDQE